MSVSLHPTTFDGKIIEEIDEETLNSGGCG